MSIKKYLTYLLAITITLIATSTFADNKTVTQVQDTKAAVKYFEDEMNFTINPGGVKSAVLEKHDVVIVDLRREEHFNAGHIPGAINIPFDKWDKFEGDQKEFPGLVEGKFHYVYCYELLCNLSQKAAKKFATLGYPVKEMKGGFKAWKNHHYPIEPEQSAK